MDAGAFVQENKRWLLGCAIGGVVWLIGSAILGSIYAAVPPSKNKLGASNDEMYDQAALQAAKDENEKLLAERARLQQELGFVPGAKFQLAGNERADDRLYRVGKEVREAILAAANSRDVQIAESNIQWEVPTGIDDQRATLFALELLDELQQRLFAAHDATKAAAEEAPGLRAILQLKLDSRKNQRGQARAKAGEVDPREFLVQEQVTFQFQADEPTAVAFFESCRRPQRTLVVDSWQVLKPVRPGEPCTVKGTLQGIAWKDTAVVEVSK
ncbi:MAG: hypothetical protein WAT39_23025 [Planctomycetota bacterium]